LNLIRVTSRYLISHQVQHTSLRKSL